MKIFTIEISIHRLGYRQIESDSFVRTDNHLLRSFGTLPQCGLTIEHHDVAVPQLPSDLVAHLQIEPFSLPEFHLLQKSSAPLHPVAYFERDLAPVLHEDPPLLAPVPSSVNDVPIQQVGPFMKQSVLQIYFPFPPGLLVFLDDKIDPPRLYQVREMLLIEIGHNLGDREVLRDMSRDAHLVVPQLGARANHAAPRLIRPLAHHVAPDLALLAADPTPETTDRPVVRGVLGLALAVIHQRLDTKFKGLYEAAPASFEQIHIEQVVVGLDNFSVLNCNIVVANISVGHDRRPRTGRQDGEIDQNEISRVDPLRVKTEQLHIPVRYISEIIFNILGGELYRKSGPVLVLVDERDSALVLTKRNLGMGVPAMRTNFDLFQMLENFLEPVLSLKIGELVKFDLVPSNQEAVAFGVKTNTFKKRSGHFQKERQRMEYGNIKFDVTEMAGALEGSKPASCAIFFAVQRAHSFVVDGAGFAFSGLCFIVQVNLALLFRMFFRILAKAAARNLADRHILNFFGRVDPEVNILNFLYFFRTHFHANYFSLIPRASFSFLFYSFLNK